MERFFGFQNQCDDRDSSDRITTEYHYQRQNTHIHLDERRQRCQVRDPGEELDGWWSTSRPEHYRYRGTQLHNHNDTGSEQELPLVGAGYHGKQLNGTVESAERLPGCLVGSATDTGF